MTYDDGLTFTYSGTDGVSSYFTYETIKYFYDNDCIDNGDGTLMGIFKDIYTMSYLEVTVTTATETIVIYEWFFPT